tara:strand:+ start:451 stop:1557 length:1107 start_codon:yes stop_codon:yes gene_type:complete
MDYKDPIQVAREILERDVIAEEVEETTDLETVVEEVEEETVEVEEGKVPPQFAKKNGKDDDDDDDDDEDDDDEELDEAETILDVDDNQSADGKKGTPTPKGKKKQPEPKMKPSKTGDATKETMKGVKEHMTALFAGEDLTEDFQSKAITIFEAAVNEQVTAIEEDLRSQHEAILAEEIEKVNEELTAKLDDYLNYVVEEWMQENELAVDTGLRSEISESFMDGLKNLFTEHYIEVPEEKYDLLENSLTTITDMEGKLNEQIEKNIELKKELLENTCAGIFTEVCTGLVDTEVEKLRSLAEGIEYDDSDQYRDKLNVLKESYFDKSNPDSSNFEETVLTEETEEPTKETAGQMADYMRAISKHSKYNKL